MLHAFCFCLWALQEKPARIEPVSFGPETPMKEQDLNNTQPPPEAHTLEENNPSQRKKKPVDPKDYAAKVMKQLNGNNNVSNHDGKPKDDEKDDSENEEKDDSENEEKYLNSILDDKKKAEKNKNKNEAKKKEEKKPLSEVLSAPVKKKKDELPEKTT